MRLRQLMQCVVSQRCVMSAGPSMAANSNVVCPPMSTLGEIFHPVPRCAAEAAPVPSTARAPPPLAPSKFSGLIDRDCALLKRASERRSITTAAPPHRCALHRRRRPQPPLLLIAALCIVAGDHKLTVVRKPVGGAVLGVVRRLIGRVPADVDPPSGEPGRQPRILALLADGQ